MYVEVVRVCVCVCVCVCVVCVYMYICAHFCVHAKFHLNCVYSMCYMYMYMCMPYPDGCHPT